MDARTKFYVLNKFYGLTLQTFALILFGCSSDRCDDIVNKSHVEQTLFTRRLLLSQKKFFFSKIYFYRNVFASR